MFFFGRRRLRRYHSIVIVLKDSLSHLPWKMLDLCHADMLNFRLIKVTPLIYQNGVVICEQKRFEEKQWLSFLKKKSFLRLLPVFVPQNCFRCLRVIIHINAHCLALYLIQSSLYCSVMKLTHHVKLFLFFFFFSFSPFFLLFLFQIITLLVRNFCQQILVYFRRIILLPTIYLHTLLY